MAENENKDLPSPEEARAEDQTQENAAAQDSGQGETGTPAEDSRKAEPERPQPGTDSSSTTTIMKLPPAVSWGEATLKDGQVKEIPAPAGDTPQDQDPAGSAPADGTPQDPAGSSPASAPDAGQASGDQAPAPEGSQGAESGGALIVPGMEEAEITTDGDQVFAEIETVLPDSQGIRPTQAFIVPVYGRPFLPGLILPGQVAAKPWKKTFQMALKSPNKTLGLFCVTPENDSQQPLVVENEGELLQKLPLTGCLIRIIHARINDNDVQFIAEGVARIRVSRYITGDKPPFLAEITYPETTNETGASDADIKAHAMTVVNTIRELLPLNHLYSEELKHFTMRFSPNKPAELADGAASITTATGRELQEVLDSTDLLTRLKKCNELLLKELELAKLQNNIRNSVEEKIQKRQRTYFLREQLKVIQKELGSTEAELMETDNKALTDFMLKLEQRCLNLKMPDAVKERYQEELTKLKLINPSSPEYEVVCSYLDWVTQLPWGIEKEENLDLKHAKQVLDEDHDALDEVRDRILEFIALGQKKGSANGSILLLVGPPGVGKTSVGKSVARALDRPFYRFSVGGLRDVSEIKGHRRTYIGAMPGKLIMALKQSKCMNPVIMLDEVDKISNSHMGNPSAALLEALDPEQNKNFMDHYIDMDVDLSKCLFICTANTTETIPSALLDRMDTIELSGYLASEKLSIARHHLLPRLMKEAHLEDSELTIPDDTIKAVIEDYAREAGVRHLEKLLAKIIRKVVVKLLEDPEKKAITVTRDDLKGYLKSPLFKPDDQLKGVGIATGLAWTSMGGATIPVEAMSTGSSGPGIRLTGSLGDVMKESAEIAYSYITASIGRFMPEKKKFFDKAKIHLHVPEGATPKDGPSAGITMASALLSLAMDKAPEPGYAMTGELTLTGRVLAIGGIREKTVAAKRLGISKIICPKQNENDVKDLPEFVTENVEYSFVETFDEVAAILFPENKPAKNTSRPGAKKSRNGKTAKVSAEAGAGPTDGVTSPAKEEKPAKSARIPKKEKAPAIKDGEPEKKPAARKRKKAASETGETGEQAGA